MLENMPFDVVEDEILARVEPLEGELMPLKWCYFRYLSEDLHSSGALPPFSLVKVDGYAVSLKDIENASTERPIALDILETVSSGQHQSKKLLKGYCTFVESGAQLPRGADAVVEVSRIRKNGNKAIFDAPVRSGEGIIEKGSVIKPNDLVMRTGDYLTPARVGVLSAIGHTEVKVVRPPVIGIISTGNELVSSDTDKLKTGQIRDANTHILSAKLTEMRLPHMSLGVVPDSRNALVDVISRVIHQVDALIITGGKVKGKKKFLEETVESSGELVVNGVRMNPGGSFSFGFFKHKYIFALPGTPSDALLVFDILIEPVIQKMMGARYFRQPVRTGILAGSISLDCDRDSFLWARFEMSDTEKFHVTPLSESFDVNLAQAIRGSCVIRLAPGVHRMSTGDAVSFIATSPDRLFTPPMYAPGLNDVNASRTVSSESSTNMADTNE